MPKLYGGRKTREVKRIKRGRKLEAGYEGKVYEVEVVVKRGKKERKLKMAEKKFHLRRKYTYFTPFCDPLRQFEMMHELQELNRREKLGLHILPTIRLRKRIGRKPTLIITKLRESKVLSTAEKAALRDQERREEGILKDHGYGIRGDMWVVQRDPKTGKVTAWIADFGNIAKQEQIPMNRKTI